MEESAFEEWLLCRAPAAPRAGPRSARPASGPPARQLARSSRQCGHGPQAPGARSAAGAGPPNAHALVRARSAGAGPPCVSTSCAWTSLAARAARGARRSRRRRFIGTCCSDKPARPSGAAPSAAGSGRTTQTPHGRACLVVRRVTPRRAGGRAGAASRRSASVLEHRGTPGRGAWRGRASERAASTPSWPRRPGAREGAPSSADAMRASRCFPFGPWIDALRAGRRDRRPRLAREGRSRCGGPSWPGCFPRSLRHAGRAAHLGCRSALRGDRAVGGAHGACLSPCCSFSRICTGPTR